MRSFDLTNGRCSMLREGLIGFPGLQIADLWNRRACPGTHVSEFQNGPAPEVPIRPTDLEQLRDEIRRDDITRLSLDDFQHPASSGRIARGFLDRRPGAGGRKVRLQPLDGKPSRVLAAEEIGSDLDERFRGKASLEDNEGLLDYGWVWI